MNTNLCPTSAGPCEPRSRSRSLSVGQVFGENEPIRWTPLSSLTESLWSYRSPTPEAPLPADTYRWPAASRLGPGGVQIPASRAVGMVYAERAWEPVSCTATTRPL